MAAAGKSEAATQKKREETMRWRVRMQVQIEELPEERHHERIAEGEIVQASDGAYEQLISERTSESIDEMAALLHRMQYQVSRQALRQHLSGVAKKKPANSPPHASGCAGTAPSTG